MSASAAHADGDSRYYGGNHNDYYDGHGFYGNRGQRMQDDAIQLGPRPFYLVQGMDEGKLKDRLMKCENGPFSAAFFRSAIAARHCSFPSIRKRLTRPGREWARASSNAIQRSRRTARWSAATTSAICTRRQISSPHP